MRAYLGAGWYLHHVSDRVIELRKDDATYRRIMGRDGYVRFRVEPGMSRHEAINGAVEVAKANDAKLAEIVAKDILVRRDKLARFRTMQQRFAQVFDTGEESGVIGRQRA